MPAKEDQELSAPVASMPSRRVNQGPVMPIGGGEEKDGTGDKEVLQSFVDLAGGKNAHIVVVPTASKIPEEMAQQYIRKVGEVLTVVNSHLFVLGPGRRSDLNGRRAIMDGAQP